MCEICSRGRHATQSACIYLIIGLVVIRGEGRFNLSGQIFSSYKNLHCAFARFFVVVEINLFRLFLTILNFFLEIQNIFCRYIYIYFFK